VEVIELSNDSFTRPSLGPRCSGYFSASIYTGLLKSICSQVLEVVVTKSGKQTYGIERFFSSLYGKSLNGLSFFTFSNVSVSAKTFISSKGRTGHQQRPGKVEPGS
jgi:hypothetical protein